MFLCFPGHCLSWARGRNTLHGKSTNVRFTIASADDNQIGIYLETHDVIRGAHKTRTRTCNETFLRYLQYTHTHTHQYTFTYIYAYARVYKYIHTHTCSLLILPSQNVIGCDTVGRVAVASVRVRMRLSRNLYTTLHYFINGYNSSGSGSGDGGRGNNNVSKLKHLTRTTSFSEK